MQEEVRQNFQAEREEKEMINQGMGEIPQNTEKKQKVQDGRDIKSNKAKHRLI